MIDKDYSFLDFSDLKTDIDIDFFKTLIFNHLTFSILCTCEISSQEQAYFPKWAQVH